MVRSLQNFPMDRTPADVYLKRNPSGLGVKEQYLEDGDEIIFHYTDDIPWSMTMYGTANGHLIRPLTGMSVLPCTENVTSRITRKKGGYQKHSYGKGNVGCDIGTQTIAYTSNTEVGLENLAERGNSIQHVERQEALILRAMERS